MEVCHGYQRPVPRPGGLAPQVARPAAARPPALPAGPAARANLGGSGPPGAPDLADPARRGRIAPRPRPAVGAGRRDALSRFGRPPAVIRRPYALALELIAS